MAAERAAEQIVTAIRRRQAEIILTEHGNDQPTEGRRLGPAISPAVSGG